MGKLSRISLDPDVMGGKPCIRGMRVTVGTIIGLLSAGHSEERILKAYPYLESEDIKEALEYAKKPESHAGRIRRAVDNCGHAE